jgi:putative GTP pyrophosphokinase
MTDAETPKASVEKILGDFHAREDTLESFCFRTKSLVEAILQDAEIPYQSIQFRVKSADKVKKKFLNPDKNYKQLDDITDLAGLRIITYYEDDIDRVAKVIKREFDFDPKNSVDKRETEPDRFGYSALNYVCRHSPKRTSDVEYKKFAGVCCEIQITSILRHAWSEIEHDWYDLRDAYPRSVKRRFYRLAALLDIAESEFQDLRQQKADFERSVALRVEAKSPDVLVDAVSLRPFIEQEPIVKEIDETVSKVLKTEPTAELTDATLEAKARALTLGGISTLQALRAALSKYKDALPEFASRCVETCAWPRGAAGRAIPAGVSVHQLGIFLMSLKGQEVMQEYLSSAKIRPDSIDLARQVAVAREIFSKY